MITLDSKLIQKAEKHLAKADPVMKGLIKRFPSFTVRSSLMVTPFEALVRAVASQQLHAAAAEAILRRFIALVPGQSFPEPEDLAGLSDDQIRSPGFSRGKIVTIRGLVEGVVQGVIPNAQKVASLDDDEIVARITTVRGIGRWTVEMLLLFHLGRPDVWPVDDFGIRKGFMIAHGLQEMPKPKALRDLGDKWQPYRSITDITHFLDDDGEIITEPAQAKVLGKYFAAIILMTSFPGPDDPPEYKVSCRRRPNRKPCLEKIASWIEPGSEDIYWICPKCKDRGRISNWKGTMWDLGDTLQVSH